MSSECQKESPAFYRLRKKILGSFQGIPGVCCKRYAELCASAVDENLSFKQKLEIWYHKVICPLCWPIVRQYAGLKELCQNLEPDGKGTEEGVDQGACLSAEEKESLKKALCSCQKDSEKAS